jgi:hypothetical protein
MHLALDFKVNGLLHATEAVHVFDLHLAGTGKATGQACREPARHAGGFFNTTNAPWSQTVPAPWGAPARTETAAGQVQHWLQWIEKRSALANPCMQVF